MIFEQIPYLLALNSLTKLSARRSKLLLDAFEQDAEAAWRQPERWSEFLSDRSSKHIQEILEQRQKLDPSELYQAFLEAGCGLCALGDPEYPGLLSHIYDPPLLLFYYGRLPEPEDICVAMIGSRNFSPYGRQVAEIFSRDLAAQGITVVSGMARGVDSVCHEGALRAGGRTIAVLGSGLDVIYPRGNELLYRHIREQGAVISEFPLGMPALAANFPQRNRIISGLCQAVLVIEASEKSGTMLTVNYALEQGRDVFAIPGPVTSFTSRGTNQLIREGAKMALSAEDIRQEYIKTLPISPSRGKGEPALGSSTPELSASEQSLLQKLLLPVQLDELALDPEVQMDVSQLAASLTMLEIRGLVRQLPGKYYQTVVKRIRR